MIAYFNVWKFTSNENWYYLGVFKKYIRIINYQRMANISIYNVGESLVIQIYRSPLKLINMLLSFNGISIKIFLVVLYTFMRYFFVKLWFILI